MIRTFVVTRAGRDPESEKARAAFAREGHPKCKVRVERVFKLEGDCDAAPLMRLLANPAAEETAREETEAERRNGAAVVEVAYRPAVVDPETESGLDAAELMKVAGLEWLRVAQRYVVEGVPQDVAEAVITKHLFNDVVQVIVGPEDYKTTLRPSGTPEPLKAFSLVGKSDDQLVQLSDDMGWYAPLPQLKALQAQEAERGRPWTDVEVEMIVQSWGDHCYHTTWKGMGLLKSLMEATREIDHPLCLSIFVDNAGAMEFYHGWSIFIKGETHNHPSAISTKGGIETKHGGCLRDVIFMGRGGYPIGSSTIMGTRPPGEADADVPVGALHPRTIVLESIDGTASYCNPMGVPMMYALYRAHPGYAKCLALGHSIGVAPAKHVTKEKPHRGDVLLLIGGATGRDGVHGATASSAQLTAEMVEKEGATVQIGHPIVERKFTSVIPLLRDSGWIRTCTDLGAGGISCCVGEITEDCGADVCLDDLPLKDASLASWEKWVSESQERGLLVVPPEHLTSAIQACRRYGVDTFILGRCRDDRRLIVTDGGETVADIDLGFLWSACPIEELEPVEPKTERKLAAPAEGAVLDAEFLRRLVGDYSCCDQSWAVTQFDSTVQGRTVVGPLTGGVPSDAHVSAPIRGKPCGMVSACAYNPRWSAADPVGSVGALMALSVTRSVAMGAAPDDITLCGNYYTPTRTPELLWYLREMVLSGAVRLSKVFGTPFISGKDSSSGTFKTGDGQLIDVPPTFVPATLCRMPDVRSVTRKAFSRPGDDILVVRPAMTPSVSGSVAQELLLGELPEDGKLPWPDDEASLVSLWKALTEHRELIDSAAAVGEGGAFLQVFHGCIAGGVGAELEMEAQGAWWNLLGEPPGGLVLTTSRRDELLAALEGFECIGLGRVVHEPGLVIRAGGRTVLSRGDWPALVARWQTAFREAVL